MANANEQRGDGQGQARKGSGNRHIKERTAVGGERFDFDESAESAQ